MVNFMIKTRIHIVEDESIVALDIQDRLTELGYTVTGVADRGAEALAQIAATPPDLVLMDIHLKGAMDGIAAADAIRHRWHIPVVFLTAFADEHTLQRAKTTEPFGYIIKPFEDREIQSTIEIALYKHGAEERLRESEQRYATTLSSIGDGVIATDAQGRVTFMNPVAEKLTGWSQAQAHGRRLAEVFKIVNELTRLTVDDPVAEVLREGKTVALADHTLLIGQDGREIPINDSAAPIVGEDGRITGTVLVFQDVSDQQQKETELRRIEWMLSPKPSRLLEIATKTQQPAYSKQEEANSPGPILDAVGLDLLPDIVRDYLDLLETASAVFERNGDFAFGMVTSDWCGAMEEASRSNCSTLDNREALASGRYHCYESCWVDAARLSIERGEAVDIACRGGLRLHAVPIFAGDEIVGSITCGYGDPPRDPATLQKVAELFKVDFADLQRLSGTYQTRPPFIIELAKSRLKSSARLIGEIVRRRILERRHQESEALLSIIFNSSHELQLLMAVEPTDEYRIVSVNQHCLKTAAKFGIPISADAIIGKTLASLLRNVLKFRAEALSTRLQRFRQAATTCLPIHYQEDFETPGGHYWSEVTIVPVLDESGACTHLLWTSHDITERIKALEALKHNEERLRLALLATSQGLYDINPQTGAIVVSPAYAHMLGYDPETFQETIAAWQDRLHPDEREQIIGLNQEVMRGECDDLRMEFRQRTKSGEWKWILSLGKIVKKDSDGKPVRILGTHTDITERKQIDAERLEMERRLLHSQKLESLGVLAGGIAHDFNNLLMIIQGFADLSLLEIPPGSSAAQKIQEIIKAVHRAADLCRQMLAYSGKGQFVIKPMYLHEVIEEMTEMLKTSISKKVQLNLNLEKNIPPIAGDPAQIRQVIMNLLINGSEAIGDKSGEINVSTSARYYNTAYLKETFHSNTLAEGMYVSIEVRDNGCGMDSTTQARIFEPFFTTKFTGRGLGMSAVLGIMRSHNGALTFFSEPRLGTTFHLLFPASTGTGTEVPPEKIVSDSTWCGSGTVLLVDDDATVMEVGRSMLEKLGCTVITAKDGREAVATYRSLGAEIDFVIMDLTMPHMSGEEAFHELHRINPTAKVFISSGYNESEISERFAGKNLAGFIQKPYLMAGLRNLLNGVGQVKHAKISD